MNLPEEIQEVRVLRLQPGDTLVLRIDAALNFAQRERVLEQLKAAAPEGVKCLVLDAGLTLEVARAEQ